MHISAGKTEGREKETRTKRGRANAAKGQKRKKENIVITWIVTKGKEDFLGQRLGCVVRARANALDVRRVHRQEARQPRLLLLHDATASVRDAQLLPVVGAVRDA
eukprot:64688-Rhodomonas_salina.3